MNISNELKVALTILAALILGFVGYRLMSDLPVLRQSNVIHTYFERADGLSPGNSVYIKGVRVGSVKRMELLPGDSVEVTMNFDLDVEIPRNSIAYLESSGLLDEKAIIVERGDSDLNLQYGDYIKGEYRGGMMETLKQEGEQLSEDVSESFEKLNQLLAQLNIMLDDTTRGKVNEVLEDLQTTAETVSRIFENQSEDMELSVEHARKFLANMDTISTRNQSRVDSVLIGLDSSVKELEILSRDLNKTNAELTQILSKINEGEGSLGKMINDPTLYHNLESLSGEMDSLVKSINEDPGRYLKHMRLIEIF